MRKDYIIVFMLIILLMLMSIIHTFFPQNEHDIEGNAHIFKLIENSYGNWHFFLYELNEVLVPLTANSFAFLFIVNKEKRLNINKDIRHLLKVLKILFLMLSLVYVYKLNKILQFKLTLTESIDNNEFFIYGLITMAFFYLIKKII